MARITPNMRFEQLKDYFWTEGVSIYDVLLSVDTVVQAGFDPRMSAEFIKQIEDPEIRAMFPRDTEQRAALLLAVLKALKDWDGEYVEMDYR